VGLGMEAVLFLAGGSFLHFILEKFLRKVSMVLLEAIHELGYHLPGLFGVRSEVFLLAVFGKLVLPFSFGFPLSFRRFCLAFIRSSWEAGVTFFMKCLSASFLSNISSISKCLEAVNQSGLKVISCSAARILRLFPGIYFSGYL
jgi:hypothetical protein